MLHLIDTEGLLLPDSQSFNMSDIDNVLGFIEHNNPMGCGYATYIDSDKGKTTTLFILVDGGTVEYTVKQSMIQEDELCQFNPEIENESEQSAFGKVTYAQSPEDQTSPGSTQ